MTQITIERDMVVEVSPFLLGESTPYEKNTVKKEETEAGVPSVSEMMDQLGIPSDKQKEFLENNIPIPSNRTYESMTEAELESLVPSVQEIMSEMLKGKPPVMIVTTEDDELPDTAQIMKELGIKGGV
jgi:acetyl esterase/lipase